MPTIDNNSFDYNYDHENDDDNIMIELPPMPSSDNFDNNHDEDEDLNTYNSNGGGDDDDDDNINNDNISPSSPQQLQQQQQQQCGIIHYITISLISFIIIGNAYLHYSGYDNNTTNNSSSSPPSSLRSSSGFLGQYAKTAITRGHRMHGNIDVHPGMDRYRSYVAVQHKKNKQKEEEEEQPLMTVAAAAGGETTLQETTEGKIVALPSETKTTTGDGGDLGRLGSEEDFGGRDFLVVDTWDHDPTSFTQGLTYGRKKYYESTGLRGQSKVRKLNKHGKVKKSIDMDSKYFGEGLSYYGTNRLIQITWQKKKGFIYKAKNLKLVKEFDFSTTRDQGWGITYDHPNRQFIVTDGSNNLHFWDRKTLVETKPRVPVLDDNGNPITNLNEIEYTPKGLLANIWYSDDIILIDPETGRVKRRFDLSTLWPKSERPPSADVLNGISVTDVEDLFLVTGKKWPTIYKVKFQGWNEIE